MMPVIPQGVHYDLPAETYHSAAGLSHSMLKHLAPPARLPVYLSKKWEPTPAMLVGTFVHNAILTPNEPLPGIVVKPKDMKFNTKEGAFWRDSQDPKLIIVTHDDFQTINNCIQSIANSPMCKRIFAAGKPEVSVFYDDPRGFIRKGRIDFVQDGDCLCDIKTVRDEGGSPDNFSRILYEERYFSQAAYYLDMWNALNPANPKKHFVFIVVEKVPPFLVSFYYVGEAALELGRARNELDLAAYLNCTKTQEWPGYADDVLKIELPTYGSGKEAKHQHEDWLAKVAKAV
jgi:hypothetical protein